MPLPAALMAAAPYAIPAASAAAGGLMSLLGRSTKPQTTQLPTLDPQQLERQQQFGQQAMQGLQDPYAGFDPIAQRARSDFRTQTMPSLAERFTSFGQGGQRSSDFTGAMAGAGADLEEGLAAQRSQYGLQNRGLLQQLLGMSQQPNFDNIYQPEQAGTMQRMGTNLLAQTPQLAAGAYQTHQLNSMFKEGGGLSKLIEQLIKAKGGA